MKWLSSCALLFIFVCVMSTKAEAAGQKLQRSRRFLEFAPRLMEAVKDAAITFVHKAQALANTRPLTPTNAQVEVVAGGVSSQVKVMSDGSHTELNGQGIGHLKEDVKQDQDGLSEQGEQLGYSTGDDISLITLLGQNELKRDLGFPFDQSHPLTLRDIVEDIFLNVIDRIEEELKHLYRAGIELTNFKIQSEPNLHNLTLVKELLEDCVSKVSHEFRTFTDSAHTHASTNSHLVSQIAEAASTKFLRNQHSSLGRSELKKEAASIVARPVHMFKLIAEEHFAVLSTKLQEGLESVEQMLQPVHAGLGEAFIQFQSLKSSVMSLL